MSVKTFMKKKKKLVEPKDYVIMDATDTNKGELEKFSNVVHLENFSPSNKLIKAKSQNDVDYDLFDIEKMEKKFFKGKGFRTSCLACVNALVENRNINVFIVVKGKVFKYYGETLAKKMRKLFNVDFDFVRTFKKWDDDKKYLKKDLDNSELDELREKLRKLEKEIVDKSNDDDKKKKKKKKKKDKKKKKKDKDLFGLFSD